MFCTQCGAQSKDGETFCSRCGGKFDNPAAEKTEQKMPSLEFTNLNNNYPYNNQNPQQNSGLFTERDFDKMSYDKSQGKSSTASIVLGIFAIILCVLNYAGIPIVHLIGIALGIAATVKGSNDRRMHYKNATVGIVLGIIAIILGAIAIMVGIIAVSMMDLSLVY